MLKLVPIISMQIIIRLGLYLQSNRNAKACANNFDANRLDCIYSLTVMLNHPVRLDKNRYSQSNRDTKLVPIILMQTIIQLG